jgi:hypothetical protein
MLASDDLAQMQSDLADVRADREEAITLRRGANTLGAQAVRVARLGGQGREADSPGAQQSVGRVVVVGSTTLDIQPGDRFNDENGVLYEVVVVRPNRGAAVIAEAKMVE